MHRAAKRAETKMAMINPETPGRRQRYRKTAWTAWTDNGGWLGEVKELKKIVCFKARPGEE